MFRILDVARVYDRLLQDDEKRHIVYVKNIFVVVERDGEVKN